MFKKKEKYREIVIRFLFDCGCTDSMYGGKKGDEDRYAFTSRYDR